MCYYVGGGVVGGDFFGGFVECQYLGLGEEVVYQQIMYVVGVFGGWQVVEGLSKVDEIGWYQLGVLVQ